MGGWGGFRISFDLSSVLGETWGIETVADNAKHEQPVLETAQVVFQRSPIHGIGGFARRFIPKNARVIEYVGERIDKAESLRRCEADNPYIFTLNQETDLDGSVGWNPARFLNHSCAPNCEAEVREERIWIVAQRDIQPGEELTFNYGFNLEDYKEYLCHCRTPNCVGFIVAEEYFEHVRRQRALAEEAADQRLRGALAGSLGRDSVAGVAAETAVGRSHAGKWNRTAPP